MKLFLKIFLTFFTIGIIPLCGLGWFVKVHIENNLVRSTNNSLYAFASEVGNDVTRVIRNSYTGVQYAARSSVMSSPQLKINEIKFELEKTRQFHPLIKDITLVDLDGDIISSVDYSFRGSFKDTAWFQKAIIGKSTISDVHVVLYPYDYVMTVAVPVLDAGGKVIRILICDLSLQYLLEINQSMKLVESGISRIFNGKGKYVVAPERQLLLKDVGLDKRSFLEKSKTTPSVAQFGDTLVAFAKISITDDFPLDWTVTIEQPTSVAYRALRQSWYAIYSTLGLCLLFIAALSGFVANQISPRVTNLLIAHRTLAEGDFSYSLQDNGHDEIGELARSYEIMRTELGGTRQMLMAYSQNLEGLVEARTEDLKTAQAKLIGAAHQAGMAEVATGVLHNIGNINTTINATLERIISGLKLVPATSLNDVIDLMEEKKNDLAMYLTEDDRGTKILPYMKLSLEEQNDKIERLLGESFTLAENLSHVNDIVALQQSYARENLKSFETIKLEDLVYDGLRILDASFRNRSIKIRSKFNYGKGISVNRPQLMQIIVNLFKNSIEAFDGLEQKNKEIVVVEQIVKMTEPEPAMIELIISDNGVGVDPKVMDKIFKYGFTTKEKYSGTGYGLHYCSNYLQSIGGSIHASSDGKGKGATFTVRYPLVPKVKVS